MTAHLARRSLGLLIAFVFILSTVPPVMAAPVGVPTALMVGDQIIINEIYRGGTLSGVGDEWIEVVLTQCLTAAQLEGFYVGDSTSSTAAKFSGYRFTNMSSIAATFPAGTVIVVGGTGSVTQNASYNPGGGDWNLLLTTSGANITGNGSNGDLAGTDVAYVDTNGTNGNATLSASGFAVRWGSTVGAFGALANVAITAPGNPGVMALVSDKNGATTAANWVAQTTTLGDPNGGTNTTWVTGLRNAGCGDPPPTASSVPANGATGVSPNTTITLNFSEQVDVATGAFTVECPVGTPVTFSSSPVLPASDTTSVVLTPSSALPPSTTCTVTAIATQITDNGIPPNQLDGDSNGTGGDNHVFTFTTIGGVSKIHDIQGSGNTATPGTFAVEAIVTGDFQGVTGVDDFKLDGFFIQEEDADADANPATSEGIFVFCQTCSTNVVVGDKVQVTGTSSEYFNMSQLNATTAGSVVVVSGGNALPTPSAITLPVPGVTATDLAGAQTQINAYYEPFEGMLVRMGAQLSVTEYFELFRYGQLVLAQGGRFRQFTDVNAPSVSGYTAHQIDLARRTVILDDDSNQQNHALAENPDIPVFHPVPGFSTTNYVRGGDTITNLTGVLHWSFAGQSGTDAWRIRPVTSAFSYAFTPANPRTSAPVAVGGNLQVGSFNTLNFFTTISTTACGPTGGQDCRGADSPSEFTRQRDKLVAAICAIDADVLGLMELENPNPSNDPEPGDGKADYVIKDLVGALNASGSSCPDKTYAFTDGTAAGTDAIRVGIIYKTSSVTPIGIPVALTSSGFTDPNSTGTPKSRPALAQTFEDNTWGERFTIVANHLKSKGSCPTTTPILDTDQSDGQGCWNDTRQKAASYLVNTWLPTDPTASGDPDFLVVGDLNAYRLEAPITNIIGAGYTNLINTYAGGSAYGYLFDGQLGYLDHALSVAALTSQVTGATEWHINSDEVNLLDYNDTVQDPSEATFDAKPTATNLYNADAYRSTDHDPVLVGLGLYPDQSDLAGSYGLAWHTGQGALRLGLLWTGEATSTPGGDTGDDGVTIDTSDWRRGGTTAATAVVTRLSGSGNAWLAGWADWNNNGSFADPGERIVNGSVIVGSNIFSSIPIPVDAVVGVPVNMRFRLYDSLTEPAALAPLAASPSGRGNGGEVEDQSIRSIPLAVLLAGFDATAQGDAVLVTWDTVSELNNQGFNLYRGGSPTAPETLLGYVPSQAPGSGAGASYQWLDEGLAAGQTFYYWLEAVDLSGATTLHGPVSATTQSPTAVTLSGLEADSRPGISAGWIGAALFLVIGLASVVLTAERRKRRVR